MKIHVKYFNSCYIQSSVQCKASQIIFDKIDGYIRKYDSNECIASFHSDEKYERIFDRVRYAIMLKSNVS